MTILSLASTTPITLSPMIRSPFVWAYKLTYTNAGTYWTTAYGAPLETQPDDITVLGVDVDFAPIAQYQSLAEVEAIEGSWYYDRATLYIHYPHTINKNATTTSYGRGISFSDNDMIYVNNIEHLPLIRSLPGVRQQVDPFDVSVLSLINGQAVLNNNGGELDYLLEQKTIGNNAFISYIPDSLVPDDGVIDPAIIQPIAGFTVDGIDFGVQEVSVKLNDKRTEGNAKIATEIFDTADYPNMDSSISGKTIPVIYGQVRAITCTPTNGLASSTTVRYRAGLTLTALGSVQIKVNDNWISKTPANINLATGEFDITDAKDSNTGTPAECRADCTGIANTTASDVIKDLNLRFAGVEYVPSNYNQAEWVAESVGIAPIGIVFGQPTTIYEAIGKIQNGCNIRFRYEIDPTGKRTIRKDNFDRTPARIPIDPTDVWNRAEITTESESSRIAGVVVVKYNQHQNQGTFLRNRNTVNQNYVLQNYRLRTEIEFDTFLTTLSQAQERASFEAQRLKDEVRIASVEIVGNLDLRIYDILPINLGPGYYDWDTGELEGRQFIGPRYCQVLAVDPDFVTGRNRLEVLVLGPVPV